MKNLSFSYFKCDDILEKFGEKEIEERFNALLDEIEAFIKANNLLEYAVVNRQILANVVVDYFYDVKRIEDFHPNIKKVNSEKVIAYMAYWLVYRKPIQVIQSDFSEKKLLTINERFALQYILDYLSERDRDGHILERDSKGLKSFAGLMLYYLIYRAKDAQSLEMIITAFLAGQIYEQIDEDISNILHSFDNQ
jgi:hypothetical protein